VTRATFSNTEFVCKKKVLFQVRVLSFFGFSRAVAFLSARGERMREICCYFFISLFEV